jgi:hypothetical protein
MRNPDTGFAAPDGGAIKQIVLDKRSIMEEFADGSSPCGVRFG